MFDNRNLVVFCTLLALLIAVPMTAGAKEFGQYSVVRPLSVAGSEIAAGAYDIHWKANGATAEVTFTVRGKIAAKVQGKIIDISTASQDDCVIVEQDASGRDVMKEIRFRGKKTRIVF